MTSNPDLSTLISTAPREAAEVRSVAPEIELLGSSDPAEREAAWSRFVSTHTPLLLRVARAVAHEHDAAMDAYTFVLGQLREDGFKRLSSYRVTAGCSFETWLAVVARRLCVDHHRARYGRARTDDPRAKEAQRERRRLADLVATAVQPELAATSLDAAAALERDEVLDALAAALGGLAPRDRLLLRYRFDDDLPAREIARLMRFSTLFHVYRRVNALLALCRSALERRGMRGSNG